MYYISIILSFWLVYKIVITISLFFCCGIVGAAGMPALPTKKGNSDDFLHS